MQLLILLLAGIYLYLGIRFFKSWFRFFLQDVTLSSTWKRLSIVLIIFASIFWIVVVPFAYLELLDKIQRSKGSVSEEAISPITERESSPGNISSPLDEETLEIQATKG